MCGSAVADDGKEEVLARLVDQITSASTKRSGKESWNTEEILNLLKMVNKQTHKTLEQIDSTLSVLTPDLKKYWCLWMEVFMNLFYLFIYLGFYIAFNTVQVISRRVVGGAEETSTYSLLGFCTVNCRPTASNYQLSHLRP